MDIRLSMDSYGQRETMKDKINEMINQINYISREIQEIKCHNK